MDGLLIGIDLCDDICRVSAMKTTDGEPDDIVFPQADGHGWVQTAVGRMSGEADFHLGKDAYSAALEGKGIFADHLLQGLIKNESHSVGEAQNPLSAQELFTAFLRCVLDRTAEQEGTGEILVLTIGVPSVDLQLINALTVCTDACGIARGRVSIVSRTEAMLCCVLSQKRELYAAESMIFDWSQGQISLSSMSVLRNTEPESVYSDRKVLEKDVSEDLTADEVKLHLADEILADHAEKEFAGRHISSVFLCGRGFDQFAAQEKSRFLQAVSGRNRRVFIDQNLFARGAAAISADRYQQKAVADGRREERRSAFPYTFLCEGRVRATILMEVLNHGQKAALILAREGTLWYDVKTNAELILDDTDSINVRIEMSGGKLVRSFSIPLDNFPKRPNKTTRVQVFFNFVSEKEALIRVVDLGFGDLFPASGAVRKSRIRIQD